MARYAIITDADNLVINICDWDGNEQTWQPDPGTYVVETDDARIGDHYVDGVFVHPPREQVPLTPFQKLVMYLQNNEYLTQEQVDDIGSE